MVDKFQVVVGIPSYNESETIGHVVEMAGAGLDKYFPGFKSVIVNCDNCSPDGTRDAFLAADVPQGIRKQYISTPEGVQGKGNNFLNLFRFGSEVDARILVAVDADLRSITPEWIKYLGYPVKDGHDFVTPLYSRHQFDGTITNHFCYPLVYALMGVDIRQPIGGDFAFSPRLCTHWLGQEWNEKNRNYGVDIFMSLNALSGDFRVCQTDLGAKIHNVSAPKLNRMFEEVVYTLFSILIENRSRWLSAKPNSIDDPERDDEAQAVQCYGPNDCDAEMADISLDIIKLKKDCRQEYIKYYDIVKKYLSVYAFKIINDNMEMDQYDIDTMLWTHIVYRFLYLFDGASEEQKMEIINALKPLYFARSITFDYQTYSYSISFAEEEIKKQAMAFLSQKPYLAGLYSSNGMNML